MRYRSAQSAIEWSIDRLKTWGEKVDPGHWQGVATEGKPDLVTKEILNLQIEFPIPHDGLDAVDQIHPNMPWAEDHFQERVGRIPTNPGKEFLNWPWWRGQVRETDIHDPTDTTTREFKFTHTYQERFWPKNAGEWEFRDDDGVLHEGIHPHHRGVRYTYGDLDDVVNLLRREPQTRQAYFPIFFPEDTGAVHHGRIPCTLGYHFLLRGGKLHCWYAIRSCDAVRHFRDDLYMACRLVHWVLSELKVPQVGDGGEGTWFYPEPWGSSEPGIMHFTAYSFHVHMGDYHLL